MFKTFYLFFAFWMISLSMYGQEKSLNVYVILSEDCPICQYMGPTLSSLEERYREDANFYAVFPVSRSNFKSIDLFKKKNELDGYETIHDEDQSLSHKLKATVTPEAIITNSDGEILYRGRVNDAYHRAGRKKRSRPVPDLEISLRKALGDIVVSQPWPDAVGCYITYNRLVTNE